MSSQIEQYKTALLLEYGSPYDVLFEYLTGNIVLDSYPASRAFIELIASTPTSALRYALRLNLGKFTLGEPAIAIDAKCSYLYAKNVIRRRFELGEKAILESEDPDICARYAIFALKRRWPEAEKIIAQDYHFNYRYTQHFITKKIKEMSHNVE